MVHILVSWFVAPSGDGVSGWLLHLRSVGWSSIRAVTPLPERPWPSIRAVTPLPERPWPSIQAVTPLPERRMVEYPGGYSIAGASVVEYPGGYSVAEASAVPRPRARERRAASVCRGFRCRPPWFVTGLTKCQTPCELIIRISRRIRGGDNNELHNHCQSLLMERNSY